MKPCYLTVKEVAELLLVSPGTIRNWCEKGGLPVTLTPGGHRRFLREDVLAFASQHEIPLGDISPSGTRVLVVDDDRAVSAYICELLGLTQERVHVEVAFDGFDAGDKLHSFQPDIVLLDLRMPGLDGYEVCKRIKRDPRKQAIRVIAMTALPLAEHQQRILAAGAELCLAKPLDSDLLFDVLGLSQAVELKDEPNSSDERE